jgi:hypothetical protein
MSETALALYDLPGVPDEIAKPAREVAALVADGVSLTAACKKHGTPITTIFVWRQRYPDLNAMFMQAIEVWTHIQADELMTIPEKGWNPQTARTHSDNIKWLVARRNRLDYGDSTAPQDQIQGALVDALQQAIRRIPRPSDDLDNIITIQPIDKTGE